MKRGVMVVCGGAGGGRGRSGKGGNVGGGTGGRWKGRRGCRSWFHRCRWWPQRFELPGKSNAFLHGGCLKGQRATGLRPGCSELVTVSLFSGFISIPINFLYAPFDQCGPKV